MCINLWKNIVGKLAIDQYIDNICVVTTKGAIKCLIIRQLLFITTSYSQLLKLFI